MWVAGEGTKRSPRTKKEQQQQQQQWERQRQRQRQRAAPPYLRREHFRDASGRGSEEDADEDGAAEDGSRHHRHHSSSHRSRSRTSGCMSTSREDCPCSGNNNGSSAAALPPSGEGYFDSRDMVRLEAGLADLVRMVERTRLAEDEVRSSQSHRSND